MFILEGIIIEVEKETQKERDIIHWFTPKVVAMARTETWLNQKQGARSSFQVFHLDGRTQGLGPSSTTLLDLLTGSLIGSGAAMTQTKAQMGCQCFRRQPNLHHTTGLNITYINSGGCFSVFSMIYFWL